MKIRSEKDIKILKASNVSEAEVEAWERDLFLGTGSEKFRIPEDIMEFGVGVMLKNYKQAKSEEVRQLIRRKILHTREVVVAGYEIMEAEGGVVWDPYFVGAVCFLHDMGRFPQAHLGSFSDAKTGFDHAEVGAEMISRERFKEASKMGIEIPRLAEAVREHSKLKYSGSDVYGKFIRDADKLGLMDYFQYHIEEYQAPRGRVTTGALRTFVEGGQVLKKDMVNRIDIFLSWLSWQFDFNFEATKSLFEIGGSQDYFLEEIKRMDESAYEKVMVKMEE